MRGRSRLNITYNGPFHEKRRPVALMAGYAYWVTSTVRSYHYRLWSTLRSRFSTYRYGYRQRTHTHKQDCTLCKDTDNSVMQVSGYYTKPYIVLDSGLLRAVEKRLDENSSKTLVACLIYPCHIYTMEVVSFIGQRILLYFPKLQDRYYMAAMTKYKRRQIKHKRLQIDGFKRFFSAFHTNSLMYRLDMLHRHTRCVQLHKGSYFVVAFNEVDCFLAEMKYMEEKVELETDVICDRLFFGYCRGSSNLKFSPVPT